MRLRFLLVMSVLISGLISEISTANETIGTNISSKKVLIMMSRYNAAAKKELLKQSAVGQPFELTMINSGGKSAEEMTTQWKNADLVLLDGMSPDLSKMLFASFKNLPAQFPNKKIISLGDLKNEQFNQNLNSDHQHKIADYFNNSGSSNYQNMMIFIANKLFSLSNQQADAPVIRPKIGFYHPQYPNKLTDDSTDFYAWLAPKSQQATIAIAIHRTAVDYDQQQVVDAMISGIEAQGPKVFAFYYDDQVKNLSYPSLLLDSQDQPRVQLIINYRSLHYVAKRKAEFVKVGVPVIHALNYIDGDSKQFAQTNAGISPGLTPFFVVLPEDSGTVDPTIIAATVDGKKVIMPAQMNALVERAVKHARLAVIENQQKKVAAFIWNYPPGEKNIGAAFLDVPSSLEQIALAMKEAGYLINTKTSDQIIKAAGKLLRPYYRSEDSRGLLSQDLADTLPLSTYLTWFNTLPLETKQQINDRWGSPADNPMVAEVNGEQVFIIPRINLGNFIVLPQGGRSNNVKDHSKLYHDMKTPVNHGYLAIYLYAREIFNADAFVHLGTHGSQEWLLGKERGLSVYDSPNLAAGNTPIFYPYIIDNVGEAMQAKRRGRATMISHLTPGFAKAGLYSDIAKLNDLITNYLLLEQGETQQNTQVSIEELVAELNLLKDLEVTKQQFHQDFASNLARLQDQLTEMSQQAQPLGVHTFGLLPKEQHLYSTMLQMLGDDFTNRAKIYEDQHQLTLPSDQQVDRLNVTHLEALAGFQLLKAHIEGRQLSDLPSLLVTDLETAQQYWDNFVNIEEISSLMSALSANYIPVGYGGDPIRNPQAVPTGRNLIGFNPSKVPSKEAYAAGVKLMEQTINDYRERHGKYPDKLAFSLWSLETMRHHGALEAQVLYALGVKPKWNAQDQVIGVDVIEMSELKRPRIDVVLSATGLYRDAFPNVMLWIAEAIDKIAQMKEDNNFVYRHSQALRKTLIAQGKSVEDADYLSTVRIFSNDSGSYGTGLASATLDSGSWDSDQGMTDVYLNRMGYAYGKDEKRWSDKVNDIDLYGKVLSGTDAVIFSRSTNLYALLTNDDPFQYFGGIGQAVRNLDGKTPEMYVSNLRRKDNVKAQTMASFLNNEMRGRYFHPRWIQAMQDSGYAGATAILDRMNNMWGWEVMTPELVRDDQWQEFFEVYIEDKYDLDIKEFFEKNNAHALAQILERMLEANRKYYWQTDLETVKKMLKTYIDLANRFDVVTNNDKFNEFVKVQAAGFGLAPLIPTAAPDIPATSAAKSPKTQQVTGQKLEQVAQDKPKEKDYSDYLPWLGFLLIFLFGAFKPMLAQQPQLKNIA